MQPSLPQGHDAATPALSGAEGAPAGDGQPLPVPAPANTIITTAALDVTAVKRAVELVRTRKQSDATELKRNISDPVAKKLVEWIVLRSDDCGASFERYVAFINENPTWPSIITLRRKAEAAAWQEKADNSRVRAFLAQLAAAIGQGQVRAGARTARPGRPQGRRDAGARDLALRRLFGRR